MIKTQVTQEPMLSVPSAIFAGLSVSVVLVVAAAILLGIILAATSLAGYHAWFLLLTNYLAVALGSLFAAKRSVGRGCRSCAANCYGDCPRASRCSPRTS